jgi:hypothetical protein
MLDDREAIVAHLKLKSLPWMLLALEPCAVTA